MKSFIWGLTCAAVMTAGAGASAAVPAGSGATVGLISKVIQDVTHKQSNADWQKAKKGEPLTAGDRVKTGEKSIAILKFLDNSLVRVRELSELPIIAQMTIQQDVKTIFGTAPETFTKKLDELGAVVGEGDVGEDGIARNGLHCVRVGLHICSGHNTEVT